MGKSPYLLRPKEQVEQDHEELDLKDDLFVEIEYESNPYGPSSDVTEQIYQASIEQSIPPMTERKYDPIRQIFYQMRSLATGNPWNRNDILIFYQQAVFMADFEDNYEEEYPCTMHYPNYQRMSYEQLRTYFTWRSKVRRGNYHPVSISYLFLYAYELMNGIGFTKTEDGLNSLIQLWEFARTYDDSLDRYIPQWLRDYGVYYNLAHEFQALVQHNHMQAFYPELHLTEWNPSFYLDLWCRISNYDIRTSKFYTDEYKELIRACVPYVIRSLDEYFHTIDLSIQDFIFVPYQMIGACSEQLKWPPFQGALFYPNPDHPTQKSETNTVSYEQVEDLTIELSKFNVYYRKNSSWFYQSAILLDSGRKIAGFILKQIEVLLREHEKFKYKIKSTELQLDEVIHNPSVKMKIVTQQVQLKQLIKQSVEEFIREKNRTIVSVDLSNLSKIREEAQETLETLSIPEELVEPTVISSFVEEEIPTSLFVTKVTQDEPEYEYEEELQDLSSMNKETNEQNEFTEFVAILSESERKAIQCILQKKDVLSVAQSEGIMLEVLLDSINEKASDTIGDLILDTDEDVMIYEDYEEVLRCLLF